MTDRRRDLAIYTPFAAAFYDRSAKQGGGAEQQMKLLAGRLAESGLTVGHIVLPVSDPVDLPCDRLDLIEREPYHGREAGLNRLSEARAVWRALRRADSEIYIVRGGGAYVPAVAAFCALHRRRFIFSCANDFDLVADTVQLSRIKLAAHRFGLRRADAIVVQSRHQLELAGKVQRPRQRVMRIPSFCEPASPASAPGSGFLWVSRLVGYKNPMRFVELARALPEEEFRMVAIVGDDTPEDLERELEAASRETPNLTVTGPVRREELMPMIATSRAVVSTSEWEGMPNVFLEAWARGVPVLTLHFDPDGLVASRRLGLVADGSFAAFVDGARALAGSADLASDLGTKGAAYVDGEHSPASVTKRWLEAIEAVR